MSYALKFPISNLQFPIRTALGGSLIKTLAAGTTGKMVFPGVKVDESTDGTLPEVSFLFIQASELFPSFSMNPGEKEDGQDEEKIYGKK